MSGEKALTLRLPADLSGALAMVAAVDDLTQSDVIRLAITAYVDARRADPEFRERAEAMTERLWQLIGGAS